MNVVEVIDEVVERYVPEIRSNCDHDAALRIILSSMLGSAIAQVQQGIASNLMEDIPKHEGS